MARAPYSHEEWLPDKLDARKVENTHDVLNRYKLPTITICVGMLAAIFVFVLMLNISMRQLKREFNSDAEQHMVMLSNWLSLNVNEMDNLSHFLVSENTDKAFRAVAQTAIKRSAFEGIYWVTSHGDKTPVLAVRDAVVRDNKMAISSLFAATLKPEILSAFKTQKPVATGPISFTGAAPHNATIGLIFPLLREGRSKEALIVLLDPTTLMERAFGPNGQFKNADGYIFDSTAFEQEKMLTGQTSEFTRHIMLSSHAASSELTRKTAAFSYSEIIPLLSRQWTVIFVPTSQYMSKANVLVPWIVMAACLALGGIGGMFLFHLINQNERTEQIVRERTIELTYTSNQLKVRSQDLKKAKEAAEAANIAKGDFLANVSHEIRTPLNSMIGLTELLLETELTVQQENHIRTVLNSSENLTEIINDILDFSKIESGKLELDPIGFDLQSAIEETAELFVPRAREKEAQLELLVHFVPGTPRYVIGDPIRIRQVLSNLINNAIKFTQAGYILITAEEMQDNTADSDNIKIKISVRDTGIGVSPDKLKMIFDKFSQADVSTTRKFGGTGLGLSICRQLTKLMQGDITAESTPAEGSTFSATMMVTRDTEAPEKTDALNYSMLRGKHALIVDDTLPSQIILSAQLNEAGIISECAGDMETGMRMLAEAKKSGRPYDLLITDYLLPEMSSEIFTQHVKDLYPDMPIMMATAMAEKGYAQIFAGAGCDAYLTKPVRASQLLAMIAMLFDARRTGKTLSMLTPLTLFRKAAPRRTADDNGFLEGATILLVEDNRANRELFTKLLDNFGCNVIAARNGEEAIEAAKQQHFDLILMDCQMPEMDGFEASNILCQMKRRGEIEDMPIIALTANAMKGDREKCLESGMNDYITKPLRKTALRATLMQWLPPKEKRVKAKNS